MKRHSKRQKSGKTVLKTEMQQELKTKKRGTVGDRQSSVTEPEQKTLYPWTRQSWRSGSTGNLYTGENKLLLVYMICVFRNSLAIFVIKLSLVSAYIKLFASTEYDYLCFVETVNLKHLVD